MEAPGPNSTVLGLCESVVFFCGASVSQVTSEPLPSTARLQANGS